jgi:hypothetical protein
MNEHASGIDAPRALARSPEALRAGSPRSRRGSPPSIRGSGIRRSREPRLRSCRRLRSRTSAAAADPKRTADAARAPTRRCPWRARSAASEESAGRATDRAVAHRFRPSRLPSRRSLHLGSPRSRPRQSFPTSPPCRRFQTLLHRMAPLRPTAPLRPRPHHRAQSDSFRSRRRARARKARAKHEWLPPSIDPGADRGARQSGLSGQRHPENTNEPTKPSPLEQRASGAGPVQRLRLRRCFELRFRAKRWSHGGGGFHDS